MLKLVEMSASSGHALLRNTMQDGQLALLPFWVLSYPILEPWVLGSSTPAKKSDCWDRLYGFRKG
jgi:hypothetical protein